MPDTQDRYKARYLREKTARKEAEQLLEEKSRDLYQMNQDLQSLAESLESKVVERTQALQKATDEAVHYAKVKGDFLANMSHELRTPMNGVLGMLNLLENAPLTARYKKIVKTASYSGNLLLKLINDILDLTKLESDKLELESLAFDPIELVEFAVEPFVAKTIENGIDLLTQIPPSIPQALIGDPTRIQQIITNLVSNAIKFTEEGYVLVQCFYEQDTFILRIVDSGIGMSKEQCSKVFSAFSQADESTTRKYGGTGLGLSICKNLVSSMRGRIDVESEPSEGTTFTVEIPMESKTSLRAQPEPAAQLNIKCIVSFSHFLERSIIEECFLHWQIQLMSFEQDFMSIKHALANETIDLLVIDDNFERSIEELKNLLVNYPNLHIVYLTKFDNFQHNSSRFTCLSRPIKRSELFDAISEVCGFASVHIEADSSELKGKFNDQRVLLVEDNLVNQEVAKELLASVNLHVSIANNGQEACDMLAKQDFELVLMDIQMPIMDGISATQQIRSWGGKYQTLPIFAMTAHNLKGDSEKSINAGMNKHITKPIVPKTLFEALSEYLEYEDAIEAVCTLPESVATPDNNKSESAIEDLPGIELEDALERVAGNKKILTKLLGMFKEQQQTFTFEFERSIERQDIETATRLAHTLKGSAANTGAMNLSSFASNLEDQLKQFDCFDDITESAFANIHKDIATISTELQTVFSSIDILISEPKTDSQPLDFNTELAIKLLEQIKDEVYLDLSVVGDNIQTLSESTKNSPYCHTMKALDSAFNSFDYDGILVNANTFLEQLKDSSQ